MNTEELKKYLSNKYQGCRSFLDNVVFPIFGEDRFIDGYEDEILKKNPEYQLMADATGIRSVKDVGMIYIDGEPLQIFDISVTDRIMMERNRVTIQSLVRRIMDQYSNAFMIFHYEDDTRWDWRFTFCHKSANKEESTDSKRYTFLLGPKQSCRTAADNFVKLYEKRESLEIGDIENAFSVEALSDRFFDGYKKIYADIIFYITGKRMVKAGGKWEERKEGRACRKILDEFSDFPNPEKAVRDYVKKLMGRLVFLQFLQKKGWLGVPLDKEWGDGDREFIQNLFANTKDKDYFIDDVLEVLFDDLNTERKDDISKLKSQNSKFKIPYLNGGLFERDETDKTDFPLPAKYMQEMLDFFSYYNFTIDENDPNDAEVGVDPEMLGRIFENLLEDNKDKGAFYTPKEIVQYMCRESLIAYLQTDVKDEATKEALRQFVTTHELSHLATNSKLVKQVDEALKNVKICDPAIGSGAFPMGLLKELYLCRSAVENINQDNSSEIKKHIIQHNIYGVDIEKGAVDIARLRFWLSLIVDEKSPQALPNLDFKIMQGNSLLEQYQGADLSTMTEKKETDTYDLFEDMADVLRFDLRKLLAKYYDCTDHKEKKVLRKQITDNVKQQLVEQGITVKFDNLDLAGNDQFFLWHTWFYDVFSQGGFDIVIGNPPYGAKTSKEDKKIFCKIYESAKTVPGKQKGSTDTFSIFIDLGYKSVATNGVAVFIVPLSVTASDAMSGLHRLLMDNCEDIYVSSYGDRPKRIFESAEQQVSIIGFRRTGNKCSNIMSTQINKRYSDESLWILLDNLKFINAKGYIRNGRIPKIGDEIELSILSKLCKIKTELGGMYDEKGTPIYYRKAGGRYYKVITKEATHSSAEGMIKVSKRYADLVGASLSSTLFYWFWLIHSDWHNLRTSELSMFPIPYEKYQDEDLKQIDVLYESYIKDLKKNSKVMKSGLKCFYARKSKKYIDKIDKFIGKKYGLTDNEIEYIINYDIRYRDSDE